MLKSVPDGPPRLYRFDEAGSTNQEAWRLFESGAAMPLAVTAARQIRGRGRLGREWHSPAGGNIHLSLLCRVPASKRSVLPFMALQAAQTCVAVLADICDVPLGVKWPNDLTSAEGRKVGGILTESRDNGKDSPIPVVVGIGLNVNSRLGEFPPELQATAGTLADLSGRTFSLDDIIGDIVMALAEWVGSLEDALSQAVAKPSAQGRFQS